MSKITTLLQRLLTLLPSRYKLGAESDSTEPADNDAAPVPVASATTNQTSTADPAYAPEAAEDEMEVVVRARKQLMWKKRIIIAVPVLLLIVIFVSVITYLSGPSDEAAEEHEASLTTTMQPEESKTTISTNPDERTQELEAELKQIKQERNALLLEKSALAERNHKLQQAAARRAATPNMQSRSRSPLPSSTTYSGKNENLVSGASPDPSGNCTISGNPETAGDLLKRCIEEFNAASEGQ